MFCTKCGTQNPDGAGYCVKCGTKLVVDGQAPQTSQPSHATPRSPAQQTPLQSAETLPIPQQYIPQQYPVSPMPQKKKSKGPFIVLGVVGGMAALFILVIIIGILAGSQDEPSSSRQENSAVTGSSAENDNVELSKTYVNTNAGISFQYPSQWEKVPEADWDDYLSALDGVIVVLAREDDDNPTLDSLILLAQFDVDEEDHENFFSDDETFLGWFEDEDHKTKETSVIDLDGVPARRVTFVNSEGDGRQYYFYIAGDSIFRLDFIWWNEDDGNLQPIFDAIIDSYTINKDQLGASAGTKQTTADSNATSEYQDMVLYKGIPVDFMLAASYNDIIEVFGEPDSSMFGGEEITYGTTAMSFEMFDWDEPYLCILQSTTLDDFTYNGQALTTDRDELTKIFGISPEDNGFGQWCYSWELMGQPVTLTADPCASSILISWWDMSNKGSSLEPQLPEGLEWVELPAIVKGQGYYSSDYIEGIIRNNTGSRVDVKIVYHVYDADGNQMNDRWDAIYNLENGNTWKFSVGIYGAASYEFVKVSIS